MNTLMIFSRLKQAPEAALTQYYQNGSIPR